MRVLSQTGGRDEPGFSLLEVLLATVIFAITFFSLAASWRYHELSLRKYRNRNAARFLLSQEMERIMSYPYSVMSSGLDDRTQDLRREIDGLETVQTFGISGEIEENADETLKDVTVRVTFDEMGQTRIMELRSRAFRSQ